MTEGTQARPERVMVLEPDAERRQMLAQTLMQSGFRCFMADSVHDALPFYQDRQDSACMLTILNARLPWCESVELLSRAQENDWPVLFLTAEAANVAHLQSLFDLPCDALVHPFSPKQLMNAVENLLLLSQSLLRTAWGYQDLGETRTVDVHIQRLRRKLGKSCIETVYKTGYKLKMA